ncbi:predicted protein [Naegleria gruberi]|uniref:Predicted protein n=1 Tax=Naegleria gruberi TaxID=5762 RepID=D2W2R8_NAEGR|nr:uncharacterized protein NAEGRDRAFT_54256 [Naegleria gruberi]EFC36692.1 predicted protein [Naegleria gruberi]|eukprot:XP_002669436.1 predicted protein [Naegleria gruberi strain NEG-M]
MSKVVFGDLFINFHHQDDHPEIYGGSSSDRLLSQHFASVYEERIAKNKKVYDHLTAFFKRKNQSAVEYIEENPLPDNDCKLALLKIVRADGRVLEHASDDLKNDELVVLAAIKENVSAIEFASQRLKTDKNFVLKALKCKPKMFVDSTLFEHLPHFHDDDEIARLAVEQQPKCLQYVSANLKNNRDVILKAIKKDGSVLEYVPDNLKDREIVLLSTKSSRYTCTLRFAPKEFTADKEIVLSAANSPGFYFLYAAESLRSDRDFVLEIVKKKGDSLRDVSPQFKKDREIVYDAVKSGRALQYADPIFWKDREIATLAVSKDAHSLSSLTDLKEDREFILNCISGANNFFTFLDYVNSSLANDNDFIDELLDIQCKYSNAMWYSKEDFKALNASRQKRIVNIDPACFENISHDELKTDRQLILDCILSERKVLENLNEEFRNDRELIRLAVKQHYGALEYASDELKNDRELVLEAILFDSTNFTFASKELRMDTEILECTIIKDSTFLEYAPESVRRDREFVLRAIRNSFNTISQYFGYNLKEDRDLILEHAKRTGSIETLPQEFKQDREIVLTAIQLYGSEFKYASRSLLNDRELLIIALRNGFRLSDYNEIELDREIVYESCRYDRNNLKNVPEQYRDDEEIVEAAISYTETGYGHYFFECVSDRLKSNVDFMRKMAKIYGYVIHYVPESLANDRELILNAVSQDASTLQYASEELKNDKEVILTALKISAECYQHISEEMKNDEEVLEALRKWLPAEFLKKPVNLNKEAAMIALRLRSLNDLDYSFKNDRQFALMAVNVNMNNLLYVSNRLKMDRNFILEIEPKTYDILNVPIRLREDREIALRSLELSGDSIMHLSAELKNEFKNNREIMLKAIKSDAVAFLYASEELQNDEEFVLECASVNGKVLQYVPLKFIHNRNVVLKCAQNHQDTLQFAVPEFLNDKEIVMHAVSHETSYSALCYALFEMRNDRDIVLRAIQHDVTALEVASYEIISDEDFIAQAMDINIESLRFAHYSLRYNTEFLKRMNKNNRIVENASKKLKKTIDFDSLVKQNK